MKFMTFNSSCAFAGVANMLEFYGVDVEDRNIALAMKLPFLFAKENGAYISGPMLQSAQWFNLYLNSVGFAMEEQSINKEQITEFLDSVDCAMIGLHVEKDSKHAVVYMGKEEDRYCFINNKWKSLEEPDRLSLAKKALLSRLDENVMVATLYRVEIKKTDFTPLLNQSCEVLEQWKKDVGEFASKEHDVHEILKVMNTLFRAVLLDGITMLGLCNKNKLADKFAKVQSELMKVIKNKETVILNEKLSMELLYEAVDEYIDWIRSSGLA